MNRVKVPAPDPDARRGRVSRTRAASGYSVGRGSIRTVRTVSLPE